MSVESEQFLRNHAARHAAGVDGAPLPLLEARALSKEFSGFKAVDGINLRVLPGSVHALIGPNGAGKSTCFNLLTKFLEPTAGHIFFRGEDVTHRTAAELARDGVVRSFQISAVFGKLTALENVRIALQRKTGTSFHFWRSEKTLASLNPAAQELLASVGLGAFSHHVAGQLPYGRKRALEIATTLALDPALLLLDEPTQGMGHEDVDRIAELIREVAKDRTVLLVEHNMSVVSRIADTITVLQRGQVIAEGNYAEVSRDPLVIEAYMGDATRTLEEAHA